MIEHKEAEISPKTAEPSTNGKPHNEKPKALPAAVEMKALPAPSAAPPKRRGWTGWLVLLVLAGLGFLGYRYYKASEKKNAAQQAAQADKLAHRPVSIAATAARRADIPVTLRGLGTVTAFNTDMVKSRVDGPIVKVNFQEGQMVTAGQVLVEIDPRTFQAAVDQAEGQLARDTAQLNDAKVNLARYQKLSDEGVIAKQQLDTQGAQVGQFQGSIEADQAAINTAKLSLSFAKITAPISGRIGLRQVDVGNIIHASDANAIAVITQLQPISVLFTIPADSLPPVMAKLNSGAKLTVEAYDRADTNKIATGTLVTVDNQIDTTTGTSRLKATFENRDNVLFPNQFVNCHLLLDEKRGVVTVPTPAVQRGQQGSYVYLVGPGNTAVMRQITVGITEGNVVEVTGGLQAGDQVVTDGQDKLQEGTNLEIRPDSGRPSPSGAAPTNTARPRGKK